MFLSVNIPIYNCEKYLPECIESVLAQSFTDFELILADDGSTDSSGSICDEYAARDSRIKVLHLKNGGTVVTRRRACAKNSGEYVFFMDSDDCLVPDLFERVQSACKACTPDMIAFNFETIGTETVIRNKNGFSEGLYEGKSLSKVRRSLIYDKRRRSFNYGGVIYSLWSKVFRRDFLEKHFPMLPLGIVKGEDLAATVVLTCAADSVYFMDFCGYQYRITPGSLMNTFKESEIQNYRKVYKFLTLKAPSVSKNSVAVWMMYMFLNYCRDAANVAASYTEFERIIERNADTEFFEIIRSARLSFPKLCDIRLMRLVKGRRFQKLYCVLRKESK